MNASVVLDRTAQLHAACALSGVTLRHVNDVAVKTSLKSVQERGRTLGQRYRIAADDADLVAFRSALTNAESLTLDDLGRRGRCAVRTLLKKARTLDTCLPV